MKAILISIRPQWVEKILNGIKKVEIRKGTAIGKAINKLIEEQGVAPMLIYCTKGNKHECLEYADNPNPNKEGKWVITSGYPYANGKVVARFNATAEEISYLDSLDVFATLKLGKSLMKRSCLTVDEMKTYLNGRNGTAIHITNLEIFDKPKEISEFSNPKYGYYKCFDDTIVGNVALTRAPQSWCYLD